MIFMITTQLIHIILILSNQSALIRSNSKYQFHSLWFDPTEAAIYHTGCEDANHYTTDAIK